MESFAFLSSLAIFLAMCGPVMASDTIMSQTYTPIPNERLGNKTPRELTVNSLAKCASVCKSDPTCTLWAFQDGTCQIGCPTCQGASVTVDILEAWGSLVKGYWIFLVFCSPLFGTNRLQLYSVHRKERGRWRKYGRKKRRKGSGTVK